MSVEMGVALALAVPAGALLVLAHQFNDSDEVFISFLGQLFHGLGMVMLLGLVYAAYEFSINYSGLQGAIAAFLAIFGLFLLVYSMVLVVRAIFNIIRVFYESAKSYMKGERAPGDKDFGRSFR